MALGRPAVARGAATSHGAVRRRCPKGAAHRCSWAVALETRPVGDWVEGGMQGCGVGLCSVWSARRAGGSGRPGGGGPARAQLTLPAGLWTQACGHAGGGAPFGDPFARRAPSRSRCSEGPRVPAGPRAWPDHDSHSAPAFPHTGPLLPMKMSRPLLVDKIEVGQLVKMPRG